MTTFSRTPLHYNKIRYIQKPNKKMKVKGKQTKIKHLYGTQRYLNATISNVDCRSAEQQPPENCKQRRARKLFHSSRQTGPPLAATPRDLRCLSSPGRHPVPHLLKTLHGFLRNSLLSWKCVASQIDLPAWDAVRHPTLWPSSAVHDGGFHELGVGFWPLVEVDVSGPHWDSCIVHTVGYADFVHFRQLRFISESC